MLEVRGLNVFYGDLQALWDVSFTVPPGALVTIVGSNGAGKSTILKTVSGLLRPRGGSLRFEGEPLERMRPHQIVARGIAQVAEGRRLFPTMTVLENLEMGTFPAAARPHRATSLDWVLGLFPVLRERRGQYAGTLSGGEQQMLAVGRALMSRPRLLLLDEPSLGLAPKVVAHLFETIQAINRTGITVLLVEQNVHHALSLASLGYALQTGRVVLHGSGPELLANDYIRRTYLGA